MKRYVWVVEAQLKGTESWDSCTCEVDDSSAIRELKEWQRGNPNYVFRLVKYVPEKEVKQ